MAEKEEPKPKQNFCDICSVSCSSPLQLCEHIVGQKHKAAAKRRAPDTLPYVNRLQYFFDTYMKLGAVIGLEYVVETQLASGYRYSCLLCGFRGDRKPTLIHITGAEHIAKYLDKHHPEYAIPLNGQSPSPETVKALQDKAVEICKKYGKKRITEIPEEDPPPQKTAKYSSDPKVNGDLHNRSLQHQDRRGTVRPGGSSGFKDNRDFLDYLKTFEIRGDEDAWIIKRITQNCMQALLRFREKQALQSKTRTEVSGHPPAPANRTESGLNFGVGKGAAPHSHAPIPPNDALQLFFDSLKNMEESEVVAMLHKIAATNPAFREIDVPSVIRYLQASGRLKTSSGAL